MAYANTHKPPDPKALAGAAALQIAIGALVITGLSTGTIPFIDKPKANPTAIFVEPDLPKPPPPEPTAQPNQPEQKTQTIYRPDTKFDLPTIPSDIPTTGEVPIDDFIVLPGPVPTSTPGRDTILVPPQPSPKATFKPVGVAPIGSPSSWFSTADYPSISVRREEEGTVGYSLQIAASGKVENCTVTRSSGHSALDRATCSLLLRRSKFAPARDGAGARVKGTYSAEIVWELP